MICPKCQAELPALSLSCAACMRAEHYAQLEEAELTLIPSILRGELDLKVLRTGKTRHLGFHDGFLTNAYCRAKLGSPFGSQVKFENRPDNLCPRCVSRLKEFSRKVATPVTR